MNLSPLIRSLDKEDFQKLLAGCRSQREAFYFQCARSDREFEFHVDLPAPDGTTEPMSNMGSWLHDEKRFPSG